MSSRTPVPFTVDWDANRVEPVLDRVRTTRLPLAPRDSGWAYGCDEVYLRSLCSHWADRFDWRAACDSLNRFPQFVVNLNGLDIHFVHVVGEAEKRRPLLLTHGWPGSHFEFWQVVEPLAFPSRFGGDPHDAFDLVIPSLPGYGFSGKPVEILGPAATARLFRQLMRDVLGYERFLAHGGDFGAMVTSLLALECPESIAGIHLTAAALRPSEKPSTEAEVAWANRARSVMGSMGAYMSLQATKPQSLAWAMADNPVGQAAWIVERFHDWSDLRRRPFESVFPMDVLLTNVMLYVLSDSFATAAWFYRGRVAEKAGRLRPGQRCDVPTAFANFHGEPLYAPPPRSWAERSYAVTRWTDFEEGGHFAAMEQPTRLVADIRAWAAELHA